MIINEGRTAAHGESDGHAPVVLVVAKAPVPGRVKTRLTPPASPEQAADIAAASLLDTLATVAVAPSATTAVAFTGELSNAARGPELAAALAKTTVVQQRTGTLGPRLAAAHADVGRIFRGRPILQIGMDTPQIDAELLGQGAELLARRSGPDVVLGLAADGGWWALGVSDPAQARILWDVPMSRADTGERTLLALRTAGLRVGLLPEVSDVDTMQDAVRVARTVPDSRFADAVAHACPQSRVGA